MGSLDLTQKHSCFRSLVSTLILLQRIYCNFVWNFLLYSQGNINVIDNDLILHDIATCFLQFYFQSHLTCRMASESSTCAFSDISEKVDSDSSKSGKDYNNWVKGNCYYREKKSESFHKIYYSTCAACLPGNEDIGGISSKDSRLIWIKRTSK